MLSSVKNLLNNIFSHTYNSIPLPYENRDNDLLNKIQTPIDKTNQQSLPREIKEYLLQNRDSISQNGLNKALSVAAFWGNRSEIIETLATNNSNVNYQD